VLTWATRLSYGVLAVVLFVLALIVSAVVVAAVLLHHVAPGPDTGKARAEVQRFYDERLPGRVDVRSCEYAPIGDSDYETFSCRVAVSCGQRVVFDVPRAAAFARSPVDAGPVGGHALRLTCATRPPG
jgi:hypothetical protein